MASPSKNERAALQHARTILIKIGTEVVNSPEGLLAMGKIGSIVEQIAHLHMQGKQIVLVSSGAVAIGRMVFKRQHMLSGSMQVRIYIYMNLAHPGWSSWNLPCFVCT
jgi:glutamate 5-kinase